MIVAKPLFEDKYFDTVRGYMPEEARLALDRQMPRIREGVSEQIDQFSDSLCKEIQAEIKAFGKNQTEALEGVIEDITNYLNKTAQDDKSSDLKNLADKLGDQVQVFKDNGKNFGKNLRNATHVAARAAGLPL